MAEIATKLPVKTERAKSGAAPMQAWQPFEALRREIDRLFNAFNGELFMSPFRRSLFEVAPLRSGERAFSGVPPADIAVRAA